MSPGRPPKPRELRREVRKEVRFSEDEYDRLCLTALKLRMDMSAFIREMVLTPDPFTVRIKNTELV